MTDTPPPEPPPAETPDDEEGAPSDAAAEPELRRPTWVDRIPRIGFVELFEKYRKRMVDRETGLPFSSDRPAGEDPDVGSLAFATGVGIALALRLFLPGCLLLFGLSFVWDFHGLIRSCSVAGMIGFGTNWVAIKMLFWPRERRPIFGHGLIPQQRDQLIEKVADEVLGKLINEELIFRKIEETRVVSRFTDGVIEKLKVVVEDPELKADLRNMILGYIGELTSDPAFRDRVASVAAERLEEFAGSSFRAWLVGKLKDVWQPPLVAAINREVEQLDVTADAILGQADGVLERLPLALEARREQIDRVLTRMLIGLVREVDIRAIVLEQLSSVTSEQLESGFREFSDDKLSFITLLGGVLGLVGGFVIIWPLPSMAAIGALVVTVTLADLALHALRPARAETT